MRRTAPGRIDSGGCSTLRAMAETLGDTQRHKMPHGARWNRLNMVGQAILAIAFIILIARVLSWVFPSSAFGQLVYKFYEGLFYGWKPFGIELNYKYVVDLVLAGHSHIYERSYLVDGAYNTPTTATGRIKELKPNAIQVATPIAVIGIRGTEFWGGPIDDTYGVLLLAGEVVVTNRAGSVTLAASGQGTDIASADEAPSPVQPWSDAKIARALASVAFH